MRILLGLGRSGSWLGFSHVETGCAGTALSTSLRATLWMWPCHQVDESTVPSRGLPAFPIPV